MPDSVTKSSGTHIVQWLMISMFISLNAAQERAKQTPTTILTEAQSGYNSVQVSYRHQCRRYTHVS